jgi:hypothetical protein
MCALRTSASNVRQVPSCTSNPLSLIHSAAVFSRHRIWRVLELLLLLRALLRGRRGMLHVQLADLSLRLLLRQSACARCHNFW